MRAKVFPYKEAAIFFRVVSFCPSCVIRNGHHRVQKTHLRHLLNFASRRGQNAADEIQDICAVREEEDMTLKTAQKWFTGNWLQGRIVTSEHYLSSQTIGLPKTWDLGRSMNLTINKEKTALTQHLPRYRATHVIVLYRIVTRDGKRGLCVNTIKRKEWLAPKDTLKAGVKQDLRPKRISV